MNIKDIHFFIVQQVEKCNIDSLLLKIAQQQHFQLIFVERYKPTKKLVSQIIEYEILRENKCHFENFSQQEVLTLQWELKKKLSISNFDLHQNPNCKQKNFVQKVTILSLLVCMLSRQFKLNQLRLLTAEELFIVLIFLASGKLVSLNSFDWVRSKMRKSLSIQKAIPTMTTVSSVKQMSFHSRAKESSQLQLLKRELRSTLQPARSKGSIGYMFKHSQRRNAANLSGLFLGKRKNSAERATVYNQKEDCRDRTMTAKQWRLSTPVRGSFESKSFFNKTRIPSQGIGAFAAQSIVSIQPQKQEKKVLIQSKRRISMFLR